MTPNIIRENGKAFRILQIGETLESGDQYRDSKSGQWMQVSASMGCRITRDDAFPFGYYRRPCVVTEDAQVNCMACGGPATSGICDDALCGGSAQ